MNLPLYIAVCIDMCHITGKWDKTMPVNCGILQYHRLSSFRRLPICEEDKYQLVLSRMAVVTTKFVAPLKRLALVQ